MTIPYQHSFHIPVMGIGFTIDTPAKVAHLGIPSVISLVDDMLMEKMREFHSKKMNLPFQSITNKVEDFRAKRITSYLNLMDKMVKDKFQELKQNFNEKGSEFEKFIEMLPDVSQLKQKFNAFIAQNPLARDIQNWIENHLQTGSIDVNIMTKVDREHYIDGVKQPTFYNDAHAALRGFAESDLESSIVLSAGMNPKLYAYFEQFADFFPNKDGYIKKKVILKVSDYRSALIQGKFMAKKGIWISEYRVESGLNCGGHAFAGDGHLLGPILEEFKSNRETLITETFTILNDALKAKGKTIPENRLEIRVTAQGGVGTNLEHQFLMDYYQVDSVGWGTPFLLVPEVTNVDAESLELIRNAKEKDLYLSDISPLGVPFNSVRGNSKDRERFANIAEGKPGSPCPKRYASQNREYTEHQICTASRQYQRLKITELNNQNLPTLDHQRKLDFILEKSCICVGLGTAPLLINDIETKLEGPGVSICPGPNMAYFNKVLTLKQMVSHIYGKSQIIDNVEHRPNMFVKELNLYIDYLKKQINDTLNNHNIRPVEYFEKYAANLTQGLNYYKKMFSSLDMKFGLNKSKMLNDLSVLETQLNGVLKPLEVETA